MNSPDPASLQNLNDIALPETVAWWPLASGWYFIIGLLLIALAWSVYRRRQRWTRNRYRRMALSELQVLTKGMCAGFPAGVEDGHCIENRSARPATILEVGSRDDRDEGNYPDVDLHCKPNRYKHVQFTRKDGTPC